MIQLMSLMIEFFTIGLFSIGGGYAVIPLIQERVVNEFGWISQQTFTDIITISQMTPGPLTVNVSTFIGLQIAGISGAVLATTGCVISGIVISMVMYRFFQKYNSSPYILETLKGLKASSLGLIISAAAVILMLAFTGTDTIGEARGIDFRMAAIFTGSFFALRKWKLNPILVMAFCGMIGCLI